MNNNTTDIEIARSVIAMAKSDNKLMTVELRKQKDAFEVLWTRSSEDAGLSWQLFAAECGLSVDPTAQEDTDSNRMVVVGFNSEGMAFYRISVPAVGEEELGAIVKLQAETRLPLKAEQMELVWRADQIKNGKIGVTIAAARRKRLQEFVEDVRSFEPAKILLDCEGIVKVWSALFSENGENAVVVNTGVQNTQVCLAENGRLSNAVVLDMGIEDLGADGVEEQTEATERFAQDMTSVLELFGCDMSGQLPVCVLSNGSAAYVSIVSSLRLAGLNARVALPDVKKLKSKSKTSVEGIYEYRVPIGLGLMALEAGADELNIFERLYSPSRQKVKKHWLYSPKITGAIAAAMLVLFVVVSYAVDVASPGAIEKRLMASGSQSDIDLLMQRQKLIKTVASQRPDLLDLLNEVNESGDRGIKLESFYFKKGQLVTITGQASNNDQLYKFQESLQERTDIKDVKMTASQNTSSTRSSSARGPSSDRGPISAEGPSAEGPSSAGGPSSARGAGGRGLKFSITFHYRNFTK